jgi:hypothetical protein
VKIANNKQKEWTGRRRRLASPQLRRKKEPWTNLSCPIDKKKSIFVERETVKGISSREKICSKAEALLPGRARKSN